VRDVVRAAVVQLGEVVLELDESLGAAVAAAAIERRPRDLDALAAAAVAAAWT
jgi:hypothetical protein